MIADVGHPRGTSRSNGVSRIELVVVVAMVGILGALTVPNLLGQLPQYHLSGAAIGGCSCSFPMTPSTTCVMMPTGILRSMSAKAPRASRICWRIIATSGRCARR